MFQKLWQKGSTKIVPANVESKDNGEKDKANTSPTSPDSAKKLSVMGLLSAASQSFGRLTKAAVVPLKSESNGNGSGKVDPKTILQLEKKADESSKVTDAALQRLVDEFERSLADYSNDYWLAFEACKIDNQEAVIAIINRAGDKLLPKHYAIDKKNKFNSKDSQGRTLLHIVAGNVNVVRVLVEVHKADINGRNDNGETSLFRAAVLGANASLVFLQQNGAVLDVVDKQGEGVLHHIVKAHSSDGLSGINLFANATCLVGWGVDVLAGKTVDSTPLGLSRQLNKADLEILFKTRLQVVLDKWLGDFMRLSATTTEQDIETNPDRVMQSYKGFHTFLHDHLRHLPDSGFKPELEAQTAALEPHVLRALGKIHLMSDKKHKVLKPENFDPQKVQPACNEVYRFLETIRAHGNKQKILASYDQNIKAYQLEVLGVIKKKLMNCFDGAGGVDYLVTTVLEYHGENPFIEGKFIIIRYPASILTGVTNDFEAGFIQSLHTTICGSILRSIFMTQERYNPSDADIKQLLDEAIIDTMKNELNMSVDIGSKGKEFFSQTKRLAMQLATEVETVVASIAAEPGNPTREDILTNAGESLPRINSAMQEALQKGTLPSYNMLSNLFKELSVCQERPNTSWLSLFGSRNSSKATVREL